MNLTDTLQHWLQGQINTAVDGHNSRLEYLESNMTHAKHLEERIKSLELRCATLSDRLQAIEAQVTAAPFIQLYERLQNLEKAYPDMATTKDLLKETDPAVMVDKMHSFLDRELNSKLQAYVRRCDIEEDVRAVLEGLSLSTRIKSVE